LILNFKSKLWRVYLIVQFLNPEGVSMDLLIPFIKLRPSHRMEWDMGMIDFIDF